MVQRPYRLEWLLLLDTAFDSAAGMEAWLSSFLGGDARVVVVSEHFCAPTALLKKLVLETWQEF